MIKTPLLHIRCLINGISPPIWRSLHLPSWLTFEQLGNIVLKAFAYSADDCSKGHFILNGRTLNKKIQVVSMENESTFSEELHCKAAETSSLEPNSPYSCEYKLRELIEPGMRFEYVLATNWSLTISVAGLAEAEPGRFYPYCIGGERAAPSHHIDSPEEYYKFLKNPKQRGLWNADQFDLDLINEKLSEGFSQLKAVPSVRKKKSTRLYFEAHGTFLKESDIQFDLHAYYHELETSYWREVSPLSLKSALSLLSRYDLLGLCMVYGIPAETATRRSLIEAKLNRLLPEAIRLQVPFFDDRQYGFLRQIVESEGAYLKFERADSLFSPYELYYFRDRLLVFPRLNGNAAELYMLPEIHEALKMDSMQSISRTQLQNANRRRIISGMFQYYGVMRMDNLLVQLSELLGEQLPLDTLIVDIQELQDYMDAVTIGDEFVMHSALDFVTAEGIWQKQSIYHDLEYKKFSLEVLDQAGDWMFVEATSDAEILISFLESRFNLNTGAAEGVAWELLHRCRWGESKEQVLELMYGILPKADSNSKKRLEEIVSDIWNRAPVWGYKGWSRTEINALECGEVTGTNLDAKDDKSKAGDIEVPEFRDAAFSQTKAAPNFGRVLSFPTRQRKQKKPD